MIACKKSYKGLKEDESIVGILKKAQIMQMNKNRREEYQKELLTARLSGRLSLATVTKELAWIDTLEMFRIKANPKKNQMRQ